jgi:hypothetical protein
LRRPQRFRVVVPAIREKRNMRDDVAACVAKWDPKTAKRMRKSPAGVHQALETIHEYLGSEQAAAVEPATVFDPDREMAVIWGVLALTDQQLVFHSASRGQVRISLKEADRVHLGPPVGGLLATRNVGGLLEISTGPADHFFELDSRDGAARMWPLLQRQVTTAKRAATEQDGTAAHVGSASEGVADELSKLARLRNEGVLTPDEFEQQKQRLLSS